MRTTLSILLLTLVAGFIGCAPEADEGMVLMPEDSPFVAFRVWIKAGSQNDPAGKEGLAVLTANMLSDGSTQTHTYDQILEILYPMATGYGASVDKEMTVFEGTVHKDNLDAFYALFKDAILAPAWNEEDFARLMSQMKNFVERTRRFSSDEELGKELLFREIYRGTLYEAPEEGFVASVDTLTLDDVKEFYNTYYTKDNIVIAVGGGYPEGFAEKVKEDFAVLAEGVPEPVAAPEPAAFEGLHFLLIQKDAPTTAISFGFPFGLKRSDPDFYEMLLVNSWLGEHRNSSSHLYQFIREARGMNYGDYSYIEAWPGGSRSSMPPANVARRDQIFQIWIRPVRNHEALFAFRAAMHELKKMVDNGLTQEQFELTKNFLHNYTVNYGTTISNRIGYALDDIFYGMPDPGYLASIRPELDKLTLEGVNAAIKKHLQYDNMWVVFITNDAEGLKKMIVNDEPSPKAYSEPTPQEVLDEDKLVEVYPLNVPEENVVIVDINEVFEK